MKKDAELHEAEDKKFKELTEVRNTADQLIFASEKSIKEHGDKTTPEEIAKCKESHTGKFLKKVLSS